MTGHLKTLFCCSQRSVQTLFSRCLLLSPVLSLRANEEYAQHCFSSILITEKNLLCEEKEHLVEFCWLTIIKKPSVTAEHLHCNAVSSYKLQGRLSATRLRKFWSAGFFTTQSEKFLPKGDCLEVAAFPYPFCFTSSIGSALQLRQTNKLKSVACCLVK